MKRLSLIYIVFRLILLCGKLGTVAGMTSEAVTVYEDIFR